MMVKPDDRTAAALSNLGRSSDWQVLESWLLKSREENIQRSFGADEARSRQAQGAVMAIDDLLRQTRSAAELSAGR